jgi:hypothetical protein
MSKSLYVVLESGNNDYDDACVSGIHETLKNVIDTRKIDDNDIDFPDKFMLKKMQTNTNYIQVNINCFYFEYSFEYECFLFDTYFKKKFHKDLGNKLNEINKKIIETHNNDERIAYIDSLITQFS